VDIESLGRPGDSSTSERSKKKERPGIRRAFVESGNGCVLNGRREENSTSEHDQRSSSKHERRKKGSQKHNTNPQGTEEDAEKREKGE